MEAPSALFQPFRALGYITADVKFAVQRRGAQTFVTVSVGKAWQARMLCASAVSIAC
jgi:U3 small nucleolar RNA-associated protein 21